MMSLPSDKRKQGICQNGRIIKRKKWHYEHSSKIISILDILNQVLFRKHHHFSFTFLNTFGAGPKPGHMPSEHYSNFSKLRS